MSQNKRTVIICAALVIMASLAIYFAFKASNLEKQVLQNESLTSDLNTKVSNYQNLENIDSILINGQYRGALNAYNKALENKDITDVNGVQLRVEIAQQLLRLREGGQNGEDIDITDTLDVLQRQLSDTPGEVRKYDSLSFLLEKTKVQLGGMKRDLRKKSFGQYLKFTSAKGDQMHYVGQVNNNQANGYGVAILNTGSRYEGSWKANKRHGEGIFYWADGEYYEGNYVDDIRTGQGTYYWPNGEKYVGQWKDDKRNGKGVFYGADGAKVTSGIWKEDKLDEPDKK